MESHPLFHRRAVSLINIAPPPYTRERWIKVKTLKNSAGGAAPDRSSPITGDKNNNNITGNKDELKFIILFAFFTEYMMLFRQYFDYVTTPFLKVKSSLKVQIWSVIPVAIAGVMGEYFFSGHPSNLIVQSKGTRRER